MNICHFITKLGENALKFNKKILFFLTLFYKKKFISWDFIHRMDLQSALVCVLVFVVSGTILFLISMFGMREKSYEEALAEQRQLTGGLLNSGKLKTKDKKPKKTGKKVKEKPTAGSANGNGAEIKEGEDRDVTDVKEETPIAAAAISASGHAKPHVEFEEPAVIEAPVNKDKVSA